MGTCSRLATVLDAEMLRRKGVSIFPPGTSLIHMQHSPNQPVPNLSSQLGDRYLLRYLLPHQVGTLLNGRNTRQYVTPTPYAPEETVSWLALPAPNQPRPNVLILDPSQLQHVYGPRWVQMGGGIEYILNSGFTATDIVYMSPDMPPDSSTPPPRWELEVK